MMQMKLQPFRRAQLNDPYYKRLAHKDKRHFWKIFDCYPVCGLFKDLFEKMTCHVAADRICLDDALNHKYFQQKEIDINAAEYELLKIYQNLPETNNFDA